MLLNVKAIRLYYKDAHSIVQVYGSVYHFIAVMHIWGLGGFIIFVPVAGIYRCEGSSFGFLLVLDDVSLVHVVSFVIC